MFAVNDCFRIANHSLACGGHNIIFPFSLVRKIVWQHPESSPVHFQIGICQIAHGRHLRVGFQKIIVQAFAHLKERILYPLGLWLFFKPFFKSGVEVWVHFQYWASTFSFVYLLELLNFLPAQFWNILAIPLPNHFAEIVNFLVVEPVFFVGIKEQRNL